MKWLRTIRWRVTLVTTTGIGLPMMGIALVLLAFLYNVVLAQMEADLRGRALMLAKLLAPELQGAPPGALDQLVAIWEEVGGVRVTVADVDGVVLASSLGMHGGRVLEERSPGLLGALRGEDNGTVWKSPNFDYQDTMYVNVPVRHDGEVVGAVRLARSLSQISAQMGRIRAALAAGLVGYLLAMLSLSVWLSRSIVRPVEDLQRSALRIAAGDLEHVIPETGTQEIVGLASTLNQTTARLRRLEGARRQYVSDVSHELRTPLASIRTIAETLTAHGAEDPELYPRYLPRIVAQTDRLARLANQLMEIAQGESGTLVGARVPVSLAEVLEEVAGVLGPVAVQRGVKLRLEGPPGVTVLGDRDRLVQVVLNLADNGVRYTPEGGTVTLRGARAGGKAIVTVADSGIGISPEHLPSVFDRFYRAERARGASSGGAGLGLAIVQQIVAAHGGTVAVDSELGRGTTFRVALDLAP